MQGKHQLRSWTGFAFLAGTWLWFYAPFLINVPRGDDLLALLPFICDWHEAQGLSAKWDLLFAQYFSHRIVLTRLAALAVTGIFGHLHLVALQVLGLALWLGIAAWFTRQAMHRHGPVAGLPVVVVLLQPLGHTNITTAMQAVQNHGILLLALATCIIIAKAVTAAGSAAAFLTSTTAMLASANGLVLPPLVATAAFLRREWRRGLLLLVGAAALTWIWFRGFTDNSRPFAPGDFIANALVMLGSPFNLGRLSLPVTLGLGSILAAAAAVVLWRRRGSAAGDAVVLFSLFLLGSVALAAAGRIGWGAGYMQQDRYSPYGLLLAAAVWLLAPPLPATRQSPVVLATLMLAVLFSATAYARVYPIVLEEKRWAQAVAANQQLATVITLSERGQWTDEQRRALDARLLRLPVPAFMETTALAGLRESLISAPAGPLLVRFDAQFDSGRGVQVLRPAGAEGVVATDFALVSDGSHLFLLPGFAERETFLHMLRHGRLLNPQRIGFIWPFPEAAASPLRLLGLFLTPDGNLEVRWEGRFDPS